MFKNIKPEWGSEDSHRKVTSEEGLQSTEVGGQCEVQGEHWRDQQYKKFEGRDLLRASKSGAE